MSKGWKSTKTSTLDLLHHSHSMIPMGSGWGWTTAEPSVCIFSFSFFYFPHSLIVFSWVHSFSESFSCIHAHIHTNISGSDFRKCNPETHWKPSGVHRRLLSFYVEGDHWAKRIKLYMAYKGVNEVKTSYTVLWSQYTLDI